MRAKPFMEYSWVDLPSRVKSPLRGLSSRETPRSRVDLPQPLGPMMAVICLGEFEGESLTWWFAVAEADVLDFEGAFGDFFHGVLSSPTASPGAS